MPPKPILGVIVAIALVTLGAGRAASQAAPAQPAAADTSFEHTTFQMDAIVITGTRTKKKIIDVPYAMERVEMADHKYERKVTIDDVLGDIPGLFMQSRYGNHDVRISMRGFGSRSNTGIRGVRILLDGIPESEPDGQTRIEAIDFQSLGSIEVVKGNASSLYTNAPGGVINFLSDVSFPRTHAVAFNQFGSFGLRQNGFKAGLRTERYGFLTTYSYHNAEGYRKHSQDYWHILNSALEINPRQNSTLRIYVYVADGLIKLPGSLTKAEYDADPRQAYADDVTRDTKRITRKGRVGLRYESLIGGDDEIEFTTYATIKYFERAARFYRLFNRDGIGGSARYVARGQLFNTRNEFSLGGDWFYQYGPIQEYENIAGIKSDILLGLTDERIGNSGFYVQNSLSLVPEKLDFLLTGRYDNIVFDIRDQLLEVRSAKQRFEDFTPKAALNYKLTPKIAAYASFGLGFDTPAGNELDNFRASSNPNTLINPDLQPQHSKNFEIGVKGGLSPATPSFLKSATFGATFFASVVEDEIVPFDVFNEVFFRNSAKTRRRGLELGLDARLASGFRARSAYTLSEFEYDKYTAATILEVDDEGNFVLSTASFSGNTVPSVPRSHLSASVSYERNLAAHAVGFVRTSFTRVSGMFVDDANSEKTESYHLVDPLVGVDVALGGVDVLLSGGVNNLLDEQHVGFVNINATSKNYYEAGEPRNYYGGLNVGRRF